MIVLLRIIIIFSGKTIFIHVRLDHKFLLDLFLIHLFIIYCIIVIYCILYIILLRPFPRKYILGDYICCNRLCTRKYVEKVARIHQYDRYRDYTIFNLDENYNISY